MPPKARVNPLDPPDKSVQGTLQFWSDRVRPYLRPGEQLQVVVPARGGHGAVQTLVLDTAVPFLRLPKNYLFVGTDQAWIVLEGGRRDHVPVRLQARLARDITLKTSWWRRFERFDQPYVIDPTEDEHVAFANSLLM